MKEISKTEREIQFVKISVGTWNNGFEPLTKPQALFIALYKFVTTSKFVRNFNSINFSIKNRI